ncbi:hypothetical protein NZ698_00285 [Chryseobacterium sp. PBS4-4]|uniref:DUF6705 domain-containing protein n=2 Tax=Chryseobacterium edaphi TaxID=2976532 RepID=A0ABT2W2Z7_9FLAO|nr:DUF6705 family protein [Chryseobacterium edaphi]MCU7615617.1 hypothetical protein [Chryseobacterium edaphi]
MKGQIVVDYASNTPLPKDYDKTGNYYLKDVNNYLNNFTGTWEYVNGNEKFQIVLTKITKHHFNIPDMNRNVYRDGISFKYKKFINNTLVFESPTKDYPSFNSVDGKLLRGNTRDYGRVTVTVNYPQAIGGGVFIEGGAYFNADCRIELLPSVLTLNGGAEAPKIKFDLYLLGSRLGENQNPAYNGMPTFSIPNNVIMTKLP